MELSQSTLDSSENHHGLSHTEVTYIQELIFKKNNTIFDMPMILSQIENRGRELEFTLEYGYYFYNQKGFRVSFTKIETENLVKKAKLIEEEISKRMRPMHYSLKYNSPITPRSILVYVKSRVLVERRSSRRDVPASSSNIQTDSGKIVHRILSFFQRIV